MFVLFLAGCALPAFETDFTAALFDAPAGGTCRIWLRRGQPFSYALPIPPEDAPARVRRTIEKLEPGGRTLEVSREWGPDGRGFRWVKLVNLHGRDQRRSWLLSEHGQVMERSYEVEITDTPASVLKHAEDLGRDAIQRAVFVHRQPGEPGFFRLLLRDPQGQQLLLECRGDGSEATWHRVITAEVTTTR